jgi:hypothetical protein
MVFFFCFFFSFCLIALLSLQVFRNPYDFGWRENWKEFLGFRDARSFCTRVLLPSSHPPAGDGLSWPTIYSSKTWGVRAPGDCSPCSYEHDGGEKSSQSNGFDNDVARRRNLRDPLQLAGSSLFDADRHRSLADFHSEFQLVKKTGL